MSNITEVGIYKLYIAIMDDKNNVNLLPPVKCTIEESEVEVRGLSVGLINQSGIDNSLSTDYGSEISLFNADGSYYGSGYFGTGRGTWSLKGNTLNTYVEGELFASYTIISATSTVSEMKMSIGDEAIWVKCKKQ